MARPIPEPEREVVVAPASKPFTASQVKAPRNLRKRLLAYFIEADEANHRYYVSGTTTIRNSSAAWCANELEAGNEVVVSRNVLDDFIPDLPEGINRFRVDARGRVWTLEPRSRDRWGDIQHGPGKVHPSTEACSRHDRAWLYGEEASR